MPFSPPSYVLHDPPNGKINSDIMNCGLFYRLASRYCHMTSAT